MSSPEVLYDRIIWSLTKGDSEHLERTGRELAQVAELDFPLFHAALNALGFHGQINLINEMMGTAWSRAKEAGHFSAAAREAYAARAADHLIFAHIETDAHEELSPVLLDDLERYFPVEQERLSEYMSLLRGVVGRQWRPSDFAVLDANRLAGLLVEFAGFCFRHRGISLAKSYLSREQLPRYLFDRQARNLFPKEDVAELLRHGRRPRADYQLPEQPLLPDGPTLLVFLRRTLQTVSPQPYAAGAMWQLLPAWLTFLDQRGLVGRDELKETEQSLTSSKFEIDELWREHEDPALTAGSGNSFGEPFEE
jgi:hypothetical protein